MATNTFMGIANNPADVRASDAVKRAMGNWSRVATREGYLPCALSQYGCTGTFSPERGVAKFADGHVEALCPNVDRHTRIARDDRNAAAVLSFFINAFNQWNANRPKGVDGQDLEKFPIYPAVFDADGNLDETPPEGWLYEDHLLSVAEREALTAEAPEEVPIQ